MDDFDFREIDKHMARELTAIQTMPIGPPETELLPIGMYNGIDLPGCHVLDSSYIVYVEIKTPELNYEVKVDNMRIEYVRVKCNCERCGKEISVDFALPPTEEDKLNWLCGPCANGDGPEEEIDES